MNIEEKRKFFLELVDKRINSLPIKRIEKYESLLGGDSELLRLKRLILTPDVVLKNKINKFFKKNLTTHLSSLEDFLNILDSINELKTIKFFIKNLKEDDIFYDIGTEKGLYTSLALEFCKEVYSFEPMPEFFNILKSNFSKYKNVILNRMAISDNVGTVSFSKDPTTIVEDVKKIYHKKSEEILVETITLDEYIKNHKAPTFIKMDIEGAEYLAIKGGINMFKNYSPVIAMEVLGWKFINNSLKAVNLLLELGYKSFILDLKGEINEVDYDFIKNTKGAFNYIFKR